MKKLLLILLCLPLLFTACKKEEEGNPSFSLVGNWNWISVTSNGYEGYYTNYPNGKVTTNSQSITSIPGDTILQLISWDMEFKNDGVLIQNFVSSSTTNSSDTSFWQKIGDSFIVGGEEHIIITLTNSNLVYTRHDIETETYNDTLWFDEVEATYSFNR